MIGLVSNARVVGRRQGRIGIVEAGTQEEAKYKTTNSQSKKNKDIAFQIGAYVGGYVFCLLLLLILVLTSLAIFVGCPRAPCAQINQNTG